MANILNIKNDIVRILFYINLISLIILIFIFSKAHLIIVIIINVILSGTCVVITKWSSKFTVQHDKMWGENNG